MTTRWIVELSIIVGIGVSSGVPPLRAGSQGPSPETAGPARSAEPSVTDFRVVLLGTGTPNPRPDRFGPSTLVEAGSERLVFDCGRSCTTRLWQLKIPLGTVKLFITHLHSDHTVGIPDLWLTGWLTNPYGTRTEPLMVWGPEGTVAMMSNLAKAYEADLRMRHRLNDDGPGNVEALVHGEGPARQGFAIAAKDFTEGVVYQKNGVRVTAFNVSHADVNAFGFRIDYKGHSVVLSGDTRPSENLVAHARGADVVIHEVGMARQELLDKSEAARQLLATHHSSPEQAGEEFSRIAPKLAVYTHFTLLSDKQIPEPTMDELISRTRTTYRGPLEVGEDLLAISIGDSVAVQRIQR
jgi:ribonuclease Z